MDIDLAAPELERLVERYPPSGAILETHALPGDVPNKCAFGGDGSLYVTSGDGLLYRAGSSIAFMR